ncbi:hypothetical protein ABDK00_017685 [Niabella insulamsoli]|uniref:hypothetical protein n=1 Tax=Niabella insulamsoli TaxID=3144874 RepID=UPI0031FD9EC6
MRKIPILLAVCFGALTMFSCSKSDVLPEEKEEGPGASFIGAWTAKDYSGEVFTYEKLSQLASNQYGYILKTNGRLTVRGNASWCGTPPLTYADFDGTWSFKDNILTLNGGYWGGKTIEKWEILSHSNQEFSAKRLSIEHIR